jgi:hypothetical protein
LMPPSAGRNCRCGRAGESREELCSRTFRALRIGGYVFLWTWLRSTAHEFLKIGKIFLLRLLTIFPE